MPVEPINENFKTIMKTRQGKEVIWYILSMTGIYSSSLDQEVNNMAFMEGRRSIGLAIIDMMMSIDPTLYPRLLLEKADAKEDGA